MKREGTGGKEARKKLSVKGKELKLVIHRKVDCRAMAYAFHCGNSRRVCFSKGPCRGLRAFWKLMAILLLPNGFLSEGVPSVLGDFWLFNVQERKLILREGLVNRAGTRCRFFYLEIHKQLLRVDGTRKGAKKSLTYICNFRNNKEVELNELLLSL